MTARRGRCSLGGPTSGAFWSTKAAIWMLALPNPSAPPTGLEPAT